MSIFSTLGMKTLNRKRDVYCDDAKIFIQVHFVREKSNDRYAFNTLKIKADPDKAECEEWYTAHGNPENFQKIVQLYMEESRIHMEDIIQEYGLHSSCFSIYENSFHSIEKWEAIAICFGLDLNLTQAKMLLKTAGYALTNSIETDLIIRFCFENDIYELEDINYILKKLTDVSLEEISS